MTYHGEKENGLHCKQHKTMRLTFKICSHTSYTFYFYYLIIFLYNEKNPISKNGSYCSPLWQVFFLLKRGAKVVLLLVEHFPDIYHLGLLEVAFHARK